MEMPVGYLNLGALVGILLFLWKFHGDMMDLKSEIAGLRERMARLEGLFEGFTRRETQETP